MTTYFGRFQHNRDSKPMSKKDPIMDLSVSYNVEYLNINKLLYTQRLLYIQLYATDIFLYSTLDLKIGIYFK